MAYVRAAVFAYRASEDGFAIRWGSLAKQAGLRSLLSGLLRLALAGLERTWSLWQEHASSVQSAGSRGHRAGHRGGQADSSAESSLIGVAAARGRRPSCPDDLVDQMT